MCRIVVVEKGILVLWWRDLTPEVFDYIANCDSNGKILNHALQKEEAEGKNRKRKRDDLGNSVILFLIFTLGTILTVLHRGNPLYSRYLYSYLSLFFFPLFASIFVHREWR